MAKSLPQIKEDYLKYKSICFDKKKVTEDPITFTKDKPSRPDTLYHESKLTHTYRTDLITLIAEQKKLNNCSYKFQIRCKEFCLEPLFRFDSDGATHLNEDLPLSKQQVTTPHFNYFDENGKSIAYKVAELEMIDYSELKDMQKFFELFCKECYIVNESDSTPEITSGDVRILEFDLSNEDLLADINFEP